MRTANSKRVSVPGKRWAVLPAVVLIQACLGGVYAWSAFVPILTTTHGLAMGRVQLVFGLAILTFTVAMVAAGRLLTRWGPRWVALAGALLFSVGHQVAAAADGRLAWLVGGYGLLVGLGIGCGYVAALTSGVRWFPQRKGLVTGVAVAGFGLGGLLLATLAEHWARAGWTFEKMFRAIGWTHGLALALGAALLVRPPDGPSAAAPAVMADLRFLRGATFRVLASGMFCGTFAGLLVIGLLKPMALDGGLGAADATRAIGGLALGNVAGRLVWGWLYDRVGYRTIPAALLLLSLAIGGMTVVGGAPFAFLGIGGLVGFGFGACFVLYAAHVATLHGVDRVGRLYPFLFVAYGLAGVVGPSCGGLLHDWTGGYSASLALAALVAALGSWRTRHPPFQPLKELGHVFR